MRTTPDTEDVNKPPTAPKPPHLEEHREFRMSDLARLAGVSKSTVSRALADSPLVNAETKARIKAIADAHNYRLNQAARNFRLKESLMIGVLIPSARHADWRISDPFFLELVGGIADAMTDKGHELLLSRARAQSGDWIRHFVDARRTDGVILLGQGLEHDEINAIGERYPRLVVWGSPAPDQTYTTVGSDNEKGGYVATRHLIEQGRRRIAYIGNTSLPEADLRYAGYRRALEEFGIDYDDRLLQVPDNTFDAGFDAARRLLRSGVEFDGLFAFSDLYAIEAIKAFREADIKVPGDIGVVGYDDLEIASYYHPSLTSIRQDRQEGGRLLVESLLGRIAGEPIEAKLLPTPIVIRESSIAQPRL